MAGIHSGLIAAHMLVYARHALEMLQPSDLSIASIRWFMFTTGGGGSSNPLAAPPAMILLLATAIALTAFRKVRPPSVTP